MSDSTPTTTAPSADTLNLLANLGLGIANIAFPGAGSAVQLGRIAAAGVIKLYDQLMASRPAEVTEEQWRALLTDEVHDPAFIDRLLNDARKNVAPTVTP